MEAQINCMQRSIWYTLTACPKPKRYTEVTVKQAFKLAGLEQNFFSFSCAEHAKGPQRAPYLKRSCTLEQGNSLKRDSLERLGWDRLEMCPCLWDERKWVSSASPAFKSSSFCCLPCTNPGTVSVKGPRALSQTPAGCASTFPHCLDCYSSLLLIIA